MIVLHKIVGDPQRSKLLAMVALQKKPAIVAKHSWTNQQDARKRG